MRIVPAPCDQPIPAKTDCWTSGVASMDSALSGGLARSCVHEVYAAENADAAAAAGFAVALSSGMNGAAGMNAQQRGVLWLRSRKSVWGAGVFQANGWAGLGGSPGDGLLGVVPDTIALLRTAVDALRCGGLGAVVVEGWGTMRELDLTASRRLALAAEKSGVPLFLLRIDAAPVASAAQTRWQVAAAPSQALPGRAPGQPTFDIELLRQRSGPCGFKWRLEWDCDRRKFRESKISGAVVAVPAGRPAADTGSRLPQPGNRYAA